MRDCDTFLMIGSTFPYSEFLPKEGQAKAVQIDIDPTMLSLRYPMDVTLVGDAALTLRALLPLLEQQAARSLARDHRKECQRHVGGRRAKAPLPARPLNPEPPFWEFSKSFALRCRPSGGHGHVHDILRTRSQNAPRNEDGNLRHAWPQWGRPSPMRLPPSSPFPDRPAFALSAMEPCRCWDSMVSSPWRNIGTHGVTRASLFLF